MAVSARNTVNKSVKGNNKKKKVVPKKQPKKVGIGEANVTTNTTTGDNAFYNSERNRIYTNSSDNFGDRKFTGVDRRYLDSIKPKTTTTTMKTWTVGGKKYNNKAKAEAAARAINQKNGYVYDKKGNATWKGKTVTPAGAGRSSDPAAKADPITGGDGAGQVDRAAGGGQVPGIPDVELAAGGNYDMSKLTPAERNALRGYNSQRDVAWQDFTTKLDDQIASALQGNTNENKFGANRYNNKFLKSYLDPLYSELGTDTTISGDPNAVYNFGTWLNDDSIGGILDTINKDKQSQFKNQFNDQGFGYDETAGTSQYASGLFDNGLDDTWINDILQTQGGEAKRQLDRALSFGQINQGGYDAAMDDFGNMRTTGEGTLSGYGDSILGGYQDTTNTALGDVYGSIGNAEFGSNINLGGRGNTIRSDADRLVSGFEGDFRTQAGNEQFFDIGDLLAKGSKGSGIFDPIKESTSGGFFGKLKDREEEDQKGRGLGSQGSF